MKGGTAFCLLVAAIFAASTCMAATSCRSKYYLIYYSNNFKCSY